MLNLDSWKKTAADYDIPADILSITEFTLRSLKTPFTETIAAETAAWLLVHLMQMEKSGAAACDLSSLKSSLYLWLDKENPASAKLAADILRHYPAAEENSAFISRDPSENTPIVEAGKCFLYLRKNYLPEQQFMSLLQEKFFPHIACDYSSLKLSEEEIQNYVSTLKTEKKAAVLSALRIIHNSNFLLLTGGPGSGKTYTLSVILKSLIDRARIVRPQHPLKIILAAPTGRAQARMLESLRSNKDLADLSEIPQEGCTLHSLLHYRADALEEHPPRLLYADVIAVDEASMIDLRLFHRLFQALPQKTKLILIGDRDQLPGIETGAVFYNMLSRKDAPGHLLKNHIVSLSGSLRSSNEDINFLARSAQLGQISQIQRFLVSELPASNKNAVHVIDTEHLSPAQITAWIKKQYTDTVLQTNQTFTGRPGSLSNAEVLQLEKIFSTMESLCILSARRDKHPLSVEALNRALMPKYLEGRFCHGMPVIIGKNIDEYQLTNGERGVLLESQNQLLCWFRQRGKTFRALPLNLLVDYIQPCYAMTIHKSQGSEFDHVLIVLPDHSEMLMNRPLLYTAITRAKRSVSILTSVKTLELSLRENTVETMLAYLFAQENPAVQKIPLEKPVKDAKTGQFNLSF